MRKRKQMLAVLLSAVMLTSMLPSAAFAGEVETAAEEPVAEMSLEAQSEEPVAETSLETKAEEPIAETIIETAAEETPENNSVGLVTGISAENAAVDISSGDAPADNSVEGVSDEPEKVRQTIAETETVTQAPQEEAASRADSVEKEVSSISYTRAEPYIAWLGSDFYEEEGEFYCETYEDDILQGDVLTVTYSDGSSQTYTADMYEWAFVGAKDSIYLDDVYINMEDFYENWKPGGTENYYEVTYEGVSCRVEIEIKDGFVESIQYDPVSRFHIEERPGDNCFYFKEGDKLTVSYKEGTSEYDLHPTEGFYYTAGDNSEDYFVSETGENVIRAEEWGNSYGCITVSREYDYEIEKYTGVYTISYQGCTDTVNNIDFFAKSISFRQSEPFGAVSEDLNTDEQGSMYLDSSLFEEEAFLQPGDVLTVNFENAEGVQEAIDYSYFKDSEDSFENRFDPDQAHSNSAPVSAQYFQVVEPDIDFELPVEKGTVFHLDVCLKYENDDEPLQFTTEDKPFTLAILTDDFTEADEIGAITGTELDITHDYGIELSFNDYPSGNGSSVKRFLIRGVQDGETVDIVQVSPSNKDDNGTYDIWIDKRDFLILVPGSYTVNWTVEAVNSRNEIIGRSQPVLYNYTIKEVIPPEDAFTFSDTVLINGVIPFWTELENSQEIHYSDDYQDNRTIQNLVETGKITKVTSSDSSVIKVSPYEYGWRGDALKKGTADITVSYTFNGKSRTLKKTVSVTDTDIYVGSFWDDWYGKNTFAAGTTHSIALKVFLRKYSVADQMMKFNKDITGSAVFSVVQYDAKLENSEMPCKDKVHLSFDKNRFVFTSDPDIEENCYVTVRIKAEAQGCVVYENLSASIVPEICSLVPSEGFLFPMSGMTSSLDLTMVRIKTGQETEIPVGKLEVSYLDEGEKEASSDLSVTDRTGKTIISGEEITADQLPLTLKADGDDSALHIKAYDEEGILRAEQTLSASDFFQKSKISLAKTSMIYSGKELKPKVIIKYGNKTITKDYIDISYGNNKNAGTAWVLVNCFGTCKTLTFKILPAAPTVKATTQTAGKGLTVSWNKGTGAAGYYVYRKIGNGSYKKVKTITSGSTVSWNDTAAKTNGYKYTYYVVGYKKVGSTVYKSANSKARTYYFVTKPSITSAQNTASKKVTVKWKKNAKASGYQVKYVTGSKTKTITINENKNISKVISSLTKGKTYKVYVRSFKKVGTLKYYSAWSAAKSVKITK